TPGQRVWLGPRAAAVAESITTSSSSASVTSLSSDPLSPSSTSPLPSSTSAAETPTPNPPNHNLLATSHHSNTPSSSYQSSNSASVAASQDTAESWCQLLHIWNPSPQRHSRESSRQPRGTVQQETREDSSANSPGVAGGEGGGASDVGDTRQDTQRLRPLSSG
ncbi:hypothetical protein GBAR_LOCUS25271, partial [Geodia barretti]